MKSLISERWSIERINNWYSQIPWLVGCNFIPSNAVNQLEMWQEDTFDPETINHELGLAASLGMNAVRVYLHDLAWQVDPTGFKERISIYLNLAERHGILTLFVIFDDCWRPEPKAGKQPEPIPGYHNYRWLNSPGQKVAVDPSQESRLKNYVQDIVDFFRDDKRILAWDAYNELGNIFLLTLGMPWYKKFPRLLIDFPKFRFFHIPTRNLFQKTVQWIREVDPSQPITAGIYLNHPKLNRELIESSDIVSFHNYNSVDNLEQQVQELKQHKRPMFCTEYLNRYDGSTFEDFLPVFKREKIGCFNWGLVAGKTQTIHRWEKRGDHTEPEVWFHDILRQDGTPFSAGEVELLKRMTNES